jgi:hypothetical protein
VYTAGGGQQEEQQQQTCAGSNDPGLHPWRQGSKAARQQGSKAARQQGSKAARQQGSKAARQQGSKAARIATNYRTVVIQRSYEAKGFLVLLFAPMDGWMDPFLLSFLILCSVRHCCRQIGCRFVLVGSCRRDKLLVTCGASINMRGFNKY